MVRFSLESEVKGHGGLCGVFGCVWNKPGANQHTELHQRILNFLFCKYIVAMTSPLYVCVCRGHGMAMRYWRHKVTTQHSVSLKKKKKKKIIKKQQQTQTQPNQSKQKKKTSERTLPLPPPPPLLGGGGASPEMGGAGSVYEFYIISSFCASGRRPFLCATWHRQADGAHGSSSSSFSSSS